MISTHVATGKRENRFCWFAEAQCPGRSSQEGSALDFTTTLHNQDGFVLSYNWSFKLDIQHTFPIFVITLPKNGKFQIFCLFGWVAYWIIHCSHLSSWFLLSREAEYFKSPWQVQENHTELCKLTRYIVCMCIVLARKSPAGLYWEWCSLA